MRVVAVVPVKSVSERVESKNFKAFHQGDSLFDLLLKKLLAAKEIHEVYISSDALEIKHQVEELGCRFIPRDKAFCNNQVPWSDVIAHVVESIPENNDTVIAWCHTTSPLFDEYDQAINAYHKAISNGEYDGLVTVANLTDFVVSEKRQPINYSWGPWHRYSQFLDKFYTITGALFVTTKAEMVKNRYVISKNPEFYVVSSLKAIDVDTPYDFKLAKLLIENKEVLSDA